MAARARAALYHRVSTVDQNPHAARKELLAAARRMGLRVALDVRETGKGANNENTPGRQVRWIFQSCYGTRASGAVASAERARYNWRYGEVEAAGDVR